MHLGFVVAFLTQHLHYLADGVAGVVGPIDYLHHGFVAIDTAVQHALRDEYVLRQYVGGVDEEGYVVLDLQGADEGFSLRCSISVIFPCILLLSRRLG